MTSTFRIPNIFNFRLRQAKTPFEAAITPKSAPVNNPWDVDMYNPQDYQEPQQQQMPDFSMAMPDYSKLYEDTGPATQRYQQHLRQAPDMQDYAPSKWRRFGAIMSGIGAGLSGGNGYDTARNIVLDPYKTAYENWMGRGQGAKEAATLEEAAANRKATIYQKILSDYMDQQRWKADFEIRWENAKTQADRNRILDDWNKIREGYQNRQLGLTEARDRATAGYQRGRLGIDQARLEEDRRQGLDRLYLGIRGADTAANRARAYETSVNRPDPVAGMSQLAMDVGAMQDLERAMVDAGIDPDPYFDYDDYDRVIGMTPTALPPGWKERYNQFVNTRRLLGTGGRK